MAGYSGRTSLQALLPKSMTITDVFATDLDAKTTGQEVLAGINSGKLLVNYIGHGSVEIWSGDDLLDDTKASSLSNGTRLPLFLVMNCWQRHCCFRKTAGQSPSGLLLA